MSSILAQLDTAARIIATTERTPDLPLAARTPATAPTAKRPDGDRTAAARDRTRAHNAARCLKRGHAVTRSGNVRHDA